MTAFIDCGEVLFRTTFCLLATAGMLGVVCFAVGTSYRLKRRHVLPGFAAGVVPCSFSASCLTRCSSVISAGIAAGLHTSPA